MNTMVHNARVAREVSKIAPYPLIDSCGVYLPPEVVESDHLLEEFDSFGRYNIPENFISSKVGVKTRRFASPEILPSELAVRAAQQALDESNVDADDIDMVIFCGITKDQVEPATAHTVNHALGLKAHHVYDVSDACYGFIRGIQDASRAIKLGEVKNALVVTGETLSGLARQLVTQLKQGVDKKTAKQWLGFLSVGDAGGAVVLSKSVSESGFYQFNHIADSKLHNCCHFKPGGDGQIVGQMLMNSINYHGKRLGEILSSKTFHNANPDYLLAHQVGKRAHDMLVKSAIVESSKIPITYPILGNLTTATFPVNFKKLMDSGEPTAGDRVIGLFSGSGLVFGHFDYVM